MVSSTNSTSSGGAPHQAGVLEGSIPTHYNATDPIVLFIIQAVIIIVACRLLHWPLSKIRQPRVIAEVVGGIVLGPTIMGKIPGYMDTIFPKESLPILSLAANLGLVLFLFLVGLEVDMRILIKNWKTAANVGALGMILPFGLGGALSYGLYNQFKTDPGIKYVGFGIYLLFVGVAMAITAFPVLARILTELKLLQSSVGTIVLSAGVANDVVGWILLALTVALVNAGSGITALYVLLVCIAYILFLVYLVRPAFVWILRKDGSLENGPSQSMVGLTLLMVLASAFFTNIIGVHAIFGAFLIGLICPHDGGFAVKLTEKIEDLVTVLFLPLYFALSGLRTNIGLLDSGLVWGYVFAVILVAFAGKIVGGTIAAKMCGLVWRESLTIGVLMSCKGLVELIVLNIGLQAGILSDRVFTIFVVMALVTTFATTPLVSVLYPPWYQKKIEAWKRGEIDWDGNNLRSEDGGSTSGTSTKDIQSTHISRITVMLRLENLPGIFAFIDLLCGKPEPTPKVHRSKAPNSETIQEDFAERSQRTLQVHGERIIELSQRTSAVMQVSEVDEFQDQDPVVNVFRTIGSFHNAAVSASVSIAPEDSFAEVITSAASKKSSDLLLIPWTETGAVTEAHDNHALTSFENRFVSQQHHHFISNVLSTSECSTAIMVNRGFGSNMERRLNTSASFHSLRSRKNCDMASVPITDPSHHIFFPFFGGVDDRTALRFVLQMASNSKVTATIVHVEYSAEVAADPGLQIPPIAQGAVRRDLPRNLSQSHVPTLSMQSEAARSTASLTAPDADKIFFQKMEETLPVQMRDRVVFESIQTRQQLQYVVVKAKSEVGLSTKNAGDLVVLGRNCSANDPHIRTELVDLLSSLNAPSGTGSETRKFLGDVAEAIIVSNVRASILVFQAGGKLLERERKARAQSNVISEKEALS